MSSVTAADPNPHVAPAEAPPRGLAPARPGFARLRFLRGRGVSYRTSLILSLSLLVVVTGLAVSALAFRGATTGTAALAHSLFQEVSDHAVTKTRGFLLRAAPIAEGIGNLAELGLARDDPDRLARQLAAVLLANPGVSWVSYSNEAGSFVGAYRTSAGNLRVNRSDIVGGRTTLVEHDVLPDGEWRLHRRDDDSGYDPRTRPFYRRAKAAGRMVWPPPYIFYEQSVPGVTCANPLFGKDGRLQGVLTVDFDLNTLSQFAQQLKISPRSHLFIMSDDGVLLAHPTHRLRVTPGQRDRGELLKIRELNDPLIEAFDAQLRPEDRDAPADATRARQFEFRHGGEDYYARATAFRVGEELVWVVGAIAPRSDFLGPARRSMAMSLAASGGALLVAVVMAMFLARRVSGPMLSLAAFMRGVGRGDLSRRADLGGAREFRQLSAELNRMISDLRDRVRLREAMAVATEVQQALLPAEPPRLPGLDVYGFSAYCDETGGDYYDYLRLDETRVLCVVGDVMGHGVGSALGMASARAILRSRAPDCGHLGELLSQLNALLVPDTHGHRFITMLLWLVDARTGAVCWANAGHNPAIVYDPACERFEESGKDGIPLGIDEAATYREHAFGPLGPGQVVLLGTDGLWESVNEAGEMFGMGRLRESVRRCAAGSARDIAAAVRRDLESFRGRRHQRDDVTLVVVKKLP